MCTFNGYWFNKLLKSVLSYWNNTQIFCIWFIHFAWSDLLRLMVSFCTGSGALETETMVLVLLLWEPGGVIGLSSSLMIDCGLWQLSTLEKTAVVLNADLLVITTGDVCWWLGGLVGTLVVSVSWAVGWRIGDLYAILSTSVSLASPCSILPTVGGMVPTCVGACRLAGTLETGRANSSTCILILLRTTLSIFTKFEWGSQVCEAPLSIVDHFLVRQTCCLTDCLGRSWGGPWHAYHACCTPVWPVVMLWLHHCWLEAWWLKGWLSAVWSLVPFLLTVYCCLLLVPVVVLCCLHYSGLFFLKKNMTGHY